ncbi:MAG: acyl-CoA dehydrogenase [Rhodospirillaceae bacterium]|nr:acyl-CoA dehydrogenase [Rhodospirillaceae bacterium]RPF95923.1 MAG: acyl-CoA dehydrogenase [Rhodospirillaceae bacterium TMED63]RZO35227.1 MAG: acyl-CoA dehydrogenase [Rhodospirillaceae bacterium]
MHIDNEQENMIDSARSMVPILLSRARKAEEDRAVPQQTFDEFTEKGFFRIHQPERFGGKAWDISMMVRLGAELGQGCGSSCWIFSNLAVQNWILGMNNPEAQEDVWGDNPAALIASSFPAKGGKVERTDGGFVANGLWSFASGVDFADWNNMQVFVPPERSEGSPEHRFALVPKSDYRVVDDWYSPGLAGTGSRTIRLDNVFIPEHRTIPSTKLMGGPSPGSKINPGALYRVPPLTLGTKVFASPALGIAKGGLGMIEDDLSGRNTVGNAPMAELPTAQVRISEAGAQIEAAEALLLKDCADAMAIAEAGGVPDINDRARWRRNNAFAVQLCVRALERLNPLVGARGLKPENDFLRMFRDVHAASLQITVAWDIQAVNAGRIRFGLPSLDPRV